MAVACPDGIDVYFENVGSAIWQAVLPLLNKFARVPISGLIAHYNGIGPGDGTDRLPATMRELSKSLTLRGFINYDFAEQHYAAFLREVVAGIADGRVRYREDIVDRLEKAPETFIGMLHGLNFGKVIVRVAAEGVVASALPQLKNNPRLFKKWRKRPGYAFKANGKMFGNAYQLTRDET